jgi:hypothetical protein
LYGSGSLPWTEYITCGVVIVACPKNYLAGKTSVRYYNRENHPNAFLPSMAKAPSHCENRLVPRLFSQEAKGNIKT